MCGQNVEFTFKLGVRQSNREALNFEAFIFVACVNKQNRCYCVLINA